MDAPSTDFLGTIHTMRAMILAAGRGERMRPLTDHCPKPLLQAGGKPLLQWHIEALVAAGITNIVINLAHLGQQIEDHFGSGRALGAHLQYSKEDQALETAGGIRQALPLLNPEHSDEPFLVINGDIHCDWPLNKAVAQGQHWKTMPQPLRLAHLVMVNNPEHNPLGDFCLQGGLVQDKTEAGPNFTFSGIGLYRPSLFQDLPLGAVHKLAPLLRSAMKQGQVSGEWHEGRWMDIGTPQRLSELNEWLISQEKEQA
jgi:N-acetyl-alpha-D-muramate 1-phosphate uridylyltransferase